MDTSKLESRLLKNYSVNHKRSNLDRIAICEFSIGSISCDSHCTISTCEKSTFTVLFEPDTKRCDFYSTIFLVYGRLLSNSSEKIKQYCISRKQNCRISRLFWNLAYKISFLEIVFQVEFSGFWKSNLNVEFQKACKLYSLIHGRCETFRFFRSIVFLVFWKLLFYPSEKFRKCRNFHE